MLSKTTINLTLSIPLCIGNHIKNTDDCFPSDQEILVGLG
jgi:hypothetical protein